MRKQKPLLLLKFGLIFLLFTAVTLCISGVATYMNQSKIFRDQEENRVQMIGTYLSEILKAQGEAFVQYQAYFLEHCQEMDIPVGFTLKDVEESRLRYEAMLAEEYPGRVLGRDVSFSELSPQTQMAYATYYHEYLLTLFEESRDSFDLAFSYYTVPTEEEYHMVYILDAFREMREDGRNIKLGIDVLEPLEEHGKMWEAWETGEVPEGFDTYDNEYGKTYAWYTPFYMDGVKMGLIGTEVEIDDYNRSIANSTLRHLFSIAFILLIMSGVLLWVVEETHIKKIRELSRWVDAYTHSKNAAIATKMEMEGKDEFSTLVNQTGSMILELDNYMKSLVQTSEELSSTKAQVDAESELARKDALTGIRNRNAYEEELKRLNWQLMMGDTSFGFAIVDLNFLKRINDNYGHEYGNTAIQECCRLVCRVFSHSLVFRIGGDEFAVILEGEDYENIEKLVEEFNGSLTENQEEPWKGISAALGYALYDPAKDNCVDNVFSRADRAMYVRKREMKALR